MVSGTNSDYHPSKGIGLHDDKMQQERGHEQSLGGFDKTHVTSID